MPIIDIETVAPIEGAEEHARVQSLADELGKVFGGSPGNTWVRLRAIDPNAYAENDNPDLDVRPTFVEVLRQELPDADELSKEMAQVASVVAAALGRDRESVHVLYSPAAMGRIGFGGQLRTS